MREKRLQSAGDANENRRPLGELGLSEELRCFVAEMPYERRSILDFVMDIACSVAPGVSVLDVGAGDAPYRELFTHARYLTNDWQESVHQGAVQADVVAPAWSLPLEPESVGVVLCTQVLEHVSEPKRVLDECFRILEKGGLVAVTVPLVWQLHELPHDYFRYAPAGITHLLEAAGFTEIEVKARNDSFTTLAQLVLNVAATMGTAADGLDAQRERSRDELARVAAYMAELSSLDVEWTFPLGYAATARRPAA